MSKTANFFLYPALDLDQPTLLRAESYTSVSFRLPTELLNALKAVKPAHLTFTDMVCIMLSQSYNDYVNRENRPATGARPSTARTARGKK